MKKSLKPIPKFKTEDEERDFWATADTSEFFDWDKAQQVVFPNLKPSTKSISLRLPESMLAELKVLANKHDIPYTSMIKILIADHLKQQRNPVISK